MQIAVFRALKGLGDLLCLVPALRALRLARPGARITLVGLVEARPFVERFAHYLDDMLEFPGWPGMPERTPQARQIPAFLFEAQARSFDLALQLHGNGTAFNPVTILLGAANTGGFYQPGFYCPDPSRFLIYHEHESEVRRCLRLVEHLGFPAQGDTLEFPLNNNDLQEFAQLVENCGIQPGNYACLHPGASTFERRWSVAQFAAIGDALARRGLQVLLTGLKNEASLTKRVAAAMKSPVVNLAGLTSLGSMAALLKNSRLLVCNDTGVSHLAAALEVPSIVIFTNSDPSKWAPLNRQLHRAIVIPGGGIFYKTGEHELVVDQILAEADELLRPEGLAFLK